MQRTWFDVLIMVAGVVLAGGSLTHWVGTSSHEDRARQMLRTVGHSLILADGVLLGVAGVASLMNPGEDRISGTALGICGITGSVTVALGLLRWLAAAPRPPFAIVGAPPPTDKDGGYEEGAR